MARLEHILGVLISCSLLVFYGLPPLKIKEHLNCYIHSLGSVTFADTKTSDLIKIYDNLTLQGLNILWRLALVVTPYVVAILAFRFIPLPRYTNFLLAMLPYLLAFRNKFKKK
mgnify:CR=1 FL=1